MWELVPISVAGVVLAFLSHAFSEYDPLHCRYRRKDSFFYAILVVVMVLFVGLRTQYNDTDNYESIYNAMDPTVELFDQLDWEIGDNPLFTITNRILLKLGFSAQSFLMFYAVLTIGLNLWFIRKYSCDVPFSVFLFLATGMFTFTMAAIKQCVAMAICLVAIDRAVQKKYISFVLWVFLAALYHPYALMYLIVPFLMFRPWSGWTVIMLAVFAVAGAVLDQLIGTIVDVTDLLGENFDAASFTGEGVNPFRVAVVAVPVLLALVTRKVITQTPDRVQYLMVNLATLNAEIMFVGLFGTANYFARLANYFLLFQAMSMPWLLTHFEPRSRRTMTWGALAGYGAYYVFSNAIYESFDYHYASVSIWDYFRSLL